LTIASIHGSRSFIPEIPASPGARERRIGVAPQLHTIYIDESGEKEYGENTSRYFVYAGVVLSAADEPGCIAEIKRLKTKVFGQSDVELYGQGG
jgi:hypothetical protein